MNASPSASSTRWISASATGCDVVREVLEHVEAQHAAERRPRRTGASAGCPAAPARTRSSRPRPGSPAAARTRDEHAFAAPGVEHAGARRQRVEVGADPLHLGQVGRVVIPGGIGSGVIVPARGVFPGPSGCGHVLPLCSGLLLDRPGRRRRRARRRRARRRGAGRGCRRRGGRLHGVRQPVGIRRWIGDRGTNRLPEARTDCGTFPGVGAVLSPGACAEPGPIPGVDPRLVLGVVGHRHRRRPGIRVGRGRDLASAPSSLPGTVEPTAFGGGCGAGEVDRRRRPTSKPAIRRPAGTDCPAIRIRRG